MSNMARAECRASRTSESTASEGPRVSTEILLISTPIPAGTRAPPSAASLPSPDNYGRPVTGLAMASVDRGMAG